MADSELESQFDKKLRTLQSQINSLSAHFQRLHREITHPSVLARIQAYQQGILGDLLGTTNRVSVANGTKSILKKDGVTLSLPQDIHTGATPEFAGMIPHVDGNALGSGTNHWKLYLINETDGDVTKDRHGYCPKLPDDATKFLNGKGLFVVPIKGSTFVLTIGTTTVVNDATVQASSLIFLQATSAAGTVLQIYPSSIIAGVSFTLTHLAAAGGEPFNYLLF